MSQAAPFGSWRSPISAQSVAADEVSLDQTSCVGQDVYWLEGRPREGGRYVLVRSSPSGQRTEITPKPFNVRTRVHEYGGGAYLATASSVFFSNFADQRLYRQDDGGEPRPITPEPATPSAERFADARATADGRLLICVRERHPADDGEAINELVVLPTDGSAPPCTIVSGHDFFSTPRISPNGQQLAWLTWDHPRMPWEGTELWIGDFQPHRSVSNRVGLQADRASQSSNRSGVRRACCISSRIAPAAETYTVCSTARPKHWRRWTPNSARRNGFSACPGMPS